MAVSVTLPALGESVTEGTVTRWLKAEGERVEADEPLLEVSTDKVDTEIPAPAAGVLASIKVAEDETVEVGAELAVIDDGTRRARRRPGPGRRARAPPRPPQPAAGRAPSTEQPRPRARSDRRGRRRRGWRRGHRRRAARAGRVRHRGHRHPLAEGRSARRSRPTSRCSRSPPTRSTPRSRRPVAGTLLEIVVGEDETAEVGAKLAVIGAAGAAPAAAPAPAAPAPAPRRPRRPAPAPGPGRPPRPRAGSGPAPPRPRRPRRLRPPGPGARAAPAPAPAPGRDRR